MGTIIVTTILGLLGMILDMLKMRKIIVAFSAVVLISLSAYNVYQYWGTETSYYHGMIVVNNFSVVFSSLLLLISGLIISLADKFFERESDKISDYVSLFIFALVGALLMVSYGNMATLFIGIEILSISLYVLAASNRKSIASNEAGMKYFLMGSFMTGFLLLGITLVYGVTGTFDIYAIRDAVAENFSSHILLVGILLLMIALLFKASIAPFHFWAPDVYTGAPTLVTAFMSTVAKVAAFGAIYKMFSIAFRFKMEAIEPILVMLIILTFMIANFSGLKQKSVKRTMAYSGVSHAAFLLLAIVSSEYESAGNLLYYSIGYALASIVVFTVITYVSHINKSDQVNAFKGLIYTHPGLSIAYIIASLSLAGIPPLAGFWGKFLILLSTVEVRYSYVAIIAIIASIISIYYYFKVIMAMTQKPFELTEEVEKPSLIYTIVAWVGVIAILFVGLFPKYFVGLV